MDQDCFNALNKAKKENYSVIYLDKSHTQTDDVIKDMMAKVYERLLTDLKDKNLSSTIFTHHIDYLNKPYYKREVPYIQTEENQIVVGYIASMTDDYFIELFKHLFPSSTLELKYKGYFE